MPTLRQLEYLLAIAETGHFGRAADTVHVSQPTLSQQLRALESRLGVTLVERGQGSVRLTPIGREVTERARHVLIAVRDIEQLSRLASSGFAGTLRFGVTPTLGPYIMPEIIAALHKEQPDLKLYIREGIPDEQARQVSTGALDMMLGPTPLNGNDLYVEPLFAESLHIVAPPDHPLAGRTDLTKADLAGQQFLSLDRRHHYHRQTKEICEDLRADLLHDYEGTSLDAIRQMVGSGLGLALLPTHYMRSEMSRGAGVARLNVSDWKAHRTIAAAWRDGAAFSDHYRTIAEFIRTFMLERQDTLESV